MAKTSALKKVPATKEPTVLTPAGARVRGEHKVSSIESVKPNPWNPNEMDEFTRKSLEVGFQEDGWVASQPLLIWRTDEKGKLRNLIIDGEHRWAVGKALGFKKVPMVFLDNLPETQAKALTVKMNQKKGKWNEEKLGILVREIQFGFPDNNLALSLGIEQDTLMVLMAQAPDALALNVDAPVGPEGSSTGMPSSNVKMVQIFLDDKPHPEFTEAIRRLAVVYKTKDVTETVLEAIRRAARSAPNAS